MTSIHRGSARDGGVKIMYMFENVWIVISSWRI